MRTGLKNLLDRSWEDLHLYQVENVGSASWPICYRLCAIMELAGEESFVSCEESNCNIDGESEWNVNNLRSEEQHSIPR